MGMGEDLNKPTPRTVQWIAPHLSESEIKLIYTLVLAAIGDDRLPAYKDGKIVGDHRDTSSNMADSAVFGSGYNTAKAETRLRAATLFGKDNK